MSIALYFGKINMSSSQLGDVFLNNTSFHTILSNLLMALKDDLTYIHHYTKQIEDRTVTESIEYSLSVKEKNDNELLGYIHKKTSVYKGYKQDKIEMRGDRAEMSDFPLYLNTVAGGLDRRDQTIGGFSFVVKIYAVPVVEIIG